MISREDVAQRAHDVLCDLAGEHHVDVCPDDTRRVPYQIADAILALIQSTSEVPVQRDERAEKLGEQLDAMVAECNANHRIIGRLEERAQNAEALAANLKRLENERAIELMRVRRELAAAEERAQKAEAAEDREASLADLLNSWARESGVAPCDRPEDAKEVADQLWAKFSHDLAAALDALSACHRSGTVLGERVRELEELVDTGDAVVGVADEYEVLWMKVNETDQATADERVLLGYVRGRLFAAVRALRAAEGRG